VTPVPSGRGSSPPGRQVEAWELVSFADHARVGDGPARFVLGDRGSGKSALLAAVAEQTQARAVWLRHAARLRVADAAPGEVILVDDIQDLPPDDLTRLLFAARRLPPGVRLIAAGDTRLLPLLSYAGVALMTLDPLTPEVAGRVVDAVSTGPIADHVRAQIIQDAGGNLRALRDLLDALDDEQRRGRRRLPDPLPMTRTAAAYWLPRVTTAEAEVLALMALLGTTRRASLERSPVLRAAAASLERWEEEGLLLADGDGIRLASPLLRSASVGRVAPDDIPRLHGLAADALVDPEVRGLRLWHRALALTRGDADAPETSRELARAAPTVHGRAGDGTVGDVLERAAELAGDHDSASRYRVSAAHVAWRAGWRARAQALLSDAEPLPDDPDVRATAALVTGMLALGGGDPRTATEQLLSGARSAAAIDPSLALDQLARATGAAIWAGDAAVMSRIVATLPADPTPSFYGQLVDATARTAARMLHGDHSQAAALHHHLAVTSPSLTTPRELIFAAETAGLLGDDDASLMLLHRASRAVEGASPRAEAAFALELLAHVNVWQGRLDAAETAAASGLVLARQLDERSDGPFQLGLLAHVAALRGDHGACARYAERATAAAGGAEPATVAWARGRAALSRGDFDAAWDLLRPMTLPESRNAIVSLYAAPDVVEAAAETGRWEGTESLLREFDTWAAAGSPWARAVSPRLHALRVGGDEGIALLRSMMEGPQGVPRPFDDARTRLLLGRALRRARRRGEAREHLRAAAAAFDHLGLAGWSARATAELRASGEATAPGEAPELSALTAQELEIALLVGDGMTNRAAAERLHLSPRTIEYHLSKIYVKLGVSQRAQLSALLPARGSD